MFESLSIHCKNDMLFWNSKVKLSIEKIKAEKVRLLRALSKSSTGSSDQFKFGIWICAWCCNVLACVVSHFVSHWTFPHSNFIIFLFFYQPTHALSSSIDRAEWLHETSWVGQPSWLAFHKRASTAKRASSLSAHPCSCNSEAISIKLSTDCPVGFKLFRIAYRATNKSADLM